MSITISSTTDSQEAVNLAAGLPATATSPESATTEAPPPAYPPAEEIDDAEAAAAKKVAEPPPAEEEEEEKDDDEEEKPEEDDKAGKARKPGRYERRIDRLEQQLAYERRIRELEAQVAGRQAAPEPPQPLPVTRPKPVQGPSEPWEDYNERVIDWTIEQREAKAAAAEARRQEAAQLAEVRDRMNAFKTKAKDFDEVLAAVDDIILPQEMHRALMTSENGPALMYALAQDRKELERLARLHPLAAVRELGKFEAKITAKEANHSAQTKPPVSQAPRPISPVGQGSASTSSTKSPEDMTQREFNAWRERQIAARRKTG